MVLTLSIENETSLANGAPTRITLASGESLDIGRNADVGWPLPDPSRFISGKHCEVRYREGGYWLYDVSSNGTYLNGEPERMQAPHRLRDGDRLAIGDFVIVARVEEQERDIRDATGEGVDVDPPPYLTTDVAPRAPDAAFGLGLEQQARKTPPPQAPAKPMMETAPSSPLEESVAKEPDTAGAASAAAFVRRFALSAGIPEDTLARRDPLALADDLGELLRVVTDNVKQLMEGRQETKRAARAGQIQAVDNNPLKFSPTTEDALEIMLGPRTRSHLEAQRAFQAAFNDLKAHQVKAFSAMQGAVKMLVEDLDPAQIEAAANSEDGGRAGWLGNRKARLWDVFLARWQAKSRHPNGLVGAFMLYFSEGYDSADS